MEGQGQLQPVLFPASRGLGSFRIKVLIEQSVRDKRAQCVGGNRAWWRDGKSLDLIRCTLLSPLPAMAGPPTHTSITEALARKEACATDPTTCSGVNLEKNSELD